MSTNRNHPMAIAAEVARLLDSDPVMAEQVKQHISEGRLCALLGISPEVPKFGSFEEMLETLEIPDRDALEYVLEKFSKAEILRALDK